MTKKQILIKQLDNLKHKKLNIIGKMYLEDNKALGHSALLLIEACIKTEIIELELESFNRLKG